MTSPTLRAIEPDDIDTILRWENDTREWTTTTTAAPFSRRNIEEYVLTYDADPFAARQLRLIIDMEGRAVGAVDIFEFDPVNRRAGVGIVIDRRDRKRGYALRAFALLAEYCRQRLGMHQLWAVTSESNAGAIRLLGKSGYECTGRFDDWIRDGDSFTDALFFRKLLQS